MTINEVLKRPGPLSPAEALALDIASKARDALPVEVLMPWKSSSIQSWQDKVFSQALASIKAHNFREAG